TRGSSTPPGHSNSFWLSSPGKSTGSGLRIKLTPSTLLARPNREVRRPMPVAVLSSARYNTNNVSPFTTDPGLNVSLSSHFSILPDMGSLKRVVVSGTMMGLTAAGLSNPPNVQSGTVCTSLSSFCSFAPLHETISNEAAKINFLYDIIINNLHFDLFYLQFYLLLLVGLDTTYAYPQMAYRKTPMFVLRCSNVLDRKVYDFQNLIRRDAHAEAIA